MARAPLQILVLLFRHVKPNSFEFAVLKRSDNDHWQGVAGGCEDNESPAQAARRETQEETGLDSTCPLYALESEAIVPVHCFAARKFWPKDLTHIPEHHFAVDAAGVEIVLSDEHTECRWLGYSAAAKLLTYDSNRAALKELRDKLRNGHLDSSRVTD